MDGGNFSLYASSAVLPFFFLQVKFELKALLIILPKGFDHSVLCRTNHIVLFGTWTCPVQNCTSNSTWNSHTPLHISDYTKSVGLKIYSGKVL